MKGCCIKQTSAFLDPRKRYTPELHLYCTNSTDENLRTHMCAITECQKSLCAEFEMLLLVALNFLWNLSFPVQIYLSNVHRSNSTTAILCTVRTNCILRYWKRKTISLNFRGFCDMQKKRAKLTSRIEHWRKTKTLRNLQALATDLISTCRKDGQSIV